MYPVHSVLFLPSAPSKSLTFAHCSVLYISTWWHPCSPTSGEGSHGLGYPMWGVGGGTGPQLCRLPAHVLDPLMDLGGKK